MFWNKKDKIAKDLSKLLIKKDMNEEDYQKILDGFEKLGVSKDKIDKIINEYSTILKKK